MEASLEALVGVGGFVSDGDWIESKDQDPNGSIRLIQLMDIGNGEFRDRSRRFINTETVARLRCTLLARGDVLIARMPDPIGRACVFPGVGQGAVTAVDVLIWRPGKRAAEARWLASAINSPDVRATIEASASGTTRQRISGGALKKLLLPIPPPVEQRRIVAKIDRLSARSRRARAELNRVTSLILRVKQRFLDDILEGANGWLKQPISDLAAVGTGATPKRGNTRYYEGGNIPWVTSGCVNDHFVESADQFITKTALLETNCKVYPVGTLLVAMYGEGQTRGKVSILGLPAATNQALAAISVPEGGSMSPDFLLWFLRANYLKLREQAAGGVQPNLNIGIIRSMLVPVPSTGTQYEIVRRIEHAFAAIDCLAAEAQSARALLTRLDQAILAKAFRGELVPQDPNDEPASVLLERIRADCAAAPPRPRGRRKA